MKAIQTKYIPDTNTSGSRIKAFDCDNNSVTIKYASDATNPHRDAALALCRKLHWNGTLVEGSTKTGSVFVWIDNQPTIEVRS